MRFLSGITSNCVGVGVDNTSVNIDKSDLSCQSKHLLYGLPCHIAHNTANMGGDAFSWEVGFDIEEVVIGSIRVLKEKAILRNTASFMMLSTGK